MATVSSPGKLQRSIWNQTAPSSRSGAAVSDLTLSLRNLSISPPPPQPSSPSPSQSRLLSAILILTQPYSTTITKLDFSYSRLSPQYLATLCSTCRSLLRLALVDCGLTTIDPHMQWPSLLQAIDLSRNKLSDIPCGIEQLLYLKYLNLSGNRITTVTDVLMKLPNLKSLHLIANPIQNVPKEMCRRGVEAMREYLEVEPLPAPASPPVSRAVRRLSLEDGRNRNHVLRQRIESLESGYDSSSRLSSIAYVSDSDPEPDIGNQDDPLPDVWPDFCPTSLPQDYKKSGSHQLCQLYLPRSASKAQVQIAEVKDLSLHPQLASNQLLLTPVVRISPHGLRFEEDEPALVVLCHCRMPGGVEGEEVAVFCSDTGPRQLPQWSKLRGEACTCTIFKTHVKFSTRHFSMFAVVSTLPYPSAKVVISSNEGGSLSLPDECPGLKVTLSQGCLVPNSGEKSITATVYYTDSPCPNDHTAALASPVVGLEPHGIEFTRSVEVTLPIPDYSTIRNALPEARLQLWTAPPDGHCWSHLTDTPLTLNLTGGIHTVTFSILHFTLFEILWNSLSALRDGAEYVYRRIRSWPVAVRCQVFMTPPQQDLSFALLVLVYKYGNPMPGLDNYPWMLADTGSSPVCLHTGEVEAVLHGFSAVQEHGEDPVLSQTHTFNGENFGLRFDFSLRLRSRHLPLTDYQTLGKLKLTQGISEVPVLELTLIKVCVCVCVCARARMHVCVCACIMLVFALSYQYSHPAPPQEGPLPRTTPQ